MPHLLHRTGHDIQTLLPFLSKLLHTPFFLIFSQSHFFFLPLSLMTLTLSLVSSHKKGVEVGDSVEDLVGVEVGDGVGDLVGVEVGDGVGDLVGVEVGDGVVGDLVGDLVKPSPPNLGVHEQVPPFAGSTTSSCVIIPLSSCSMRWQCTIIRPAWTLACRKETAINN